MLSLNFSIRYRPFPESFKAVDAIYSSAEDAIYSNLRDEVEEISSNAATATDLVNGDFSPHYDFIGRSYQNSIEEEKKRREIYDSILTKDVPKTSALPSSYAEFKPTSEREHGIKELLDTEINYCNALQLIVEKFHNKLRFKLSSDDFETIFMNLTVI